MNELSTTTIKEEENFKVVQLPDGKFKKIMKYRSITTFNPETLEEKKKLFTIMNDTTGTLVTPLKEMKNKSFKIKNVLTMPYESFDEETGETTSGVTTTFEDTEGSYYATSSKSVYYSILSMMQAFGTPNTPNYEPIEVVVLATKRENREQLNIQLV